MHSLPVKLEPRVLTASTIVHLEAEVRTQARMWLQVKQKLTLDMSIWTKEKKKVACLENEGLLLQVKTAETICLVPGLCMSNLRSPVGWMPVLYVYITRLSKHNKIKHVCPRSGPLPDMADKTANCKVMTAGVRPSSRSQDPDVRPRGTDYC